MFTLNDLTPEQKAQIVNGCGAKTGPFAFIHPPAGHADIHCDAHDVAYWIGGSEADRWRADWHLMRGLLGDATGRPIWQRWVFRLKALIFWVAVRCGGWTAFHYGRQRTIQDIP